MRELMVIALIVAARAALPARGPEIGAQISGIHADFAPLPAQYLPGVGVDRATYLPGTPPWPVYGTATHVSAPGYLPSPPFGRRYAAQHTAAPATISQQHHSQDEAGQYSYGYANVNSAKQETKTADGVVRGSYSYIDGNGVTQTVNYVSDGLGFRATGTNLPAAPVLPPHGARRKRQALLLPYAAPASAGVIGFPSQLASPFVFSHSHVVFPAATAYPVPATLPPRVAKALQKAKKAQRRPGQYSYSYVSFNNHGHEIRSEDGETHVTYSRADASGDQPAVEASLDEATTAAPDEAKTEAAGATEPPSIAAPDARPASGTPATPTARYVIPVPVTETPEVAAARAAHLAAHAVAAAVHKH